MIPVARISRRQLAELSYVLAAISRRIAEAGGPDPEAHRDALALVDAFVRGEKTTKKALRAARDAAMAENNRYGVHSAPLQQARYWLPVGALVSMADTLEDQSELVLTHAGYAMPGDGGAVLSWGEREARLAVLKDEARAVCAGIDATPLEPPPRPAKTSAKEAEHTDVARAALDPAVRPLFERLGAVRSAGVVKSRDAVEKLLRKHGYPVSEPVLEFEERFGGLMVPTTDKEGWRERGEWVLMGVAACIAGGGKKPPRGGPGNAAQGLVPVVMGPQDDVTFLDPSGRAWWHDTIGARDAVPFGEGGPELVARWLCAACTLAGRYSGAQALRNGTALAVAESLALSLVAVDDRRRYWASGEAVVVEWDAMPFATTFTTEAWAKVKLFG